MKRILLIPLIALGTAVQAQNVKVINPDTQPVPVKVTSGGGGGGGVSSVAVTGANGIGVTGSPITSSGTIALSLPITIAGTAGKTATFSNSLTFTGTDASTVAFGAGGTVRYVAPRVTSTTTSATPTPNVDTTDLYILTALTDATATFGAPTGTPAQGQRLMIRITDSGGPRTLAWNSGTGGYSASTDLALPLTTTAAKTMYLLFIYNATGTAKWNLLAKLDNF